MPKIPQAQRRFFGTAVTPGAIGLAAAPFKAAASAVDSISNAFQQVKQRELTTQATKISSDFDLQLTEGFASIRNDPNVQDNPSSARELTAKMFNDLRNSPQFTQLPGEIKGAIGGKLNLLSNNFSKQALAFELKQNATNTAINLDETQDNYDLMSLTTDKPLEEMKADYATAILSARHSGALSKENAVKQAEAAFQSITLNRANRLLNSGDIAATRAFLAQEDVQEDLGADSLQKMNNQVDRKEEALKKEAIRLNEKRLKLFTDDPAQLAVNQGATSPDQIVAEQSALGVAPDNIRIIPNQEAALAANQLNGVDNADVMAIQMNELQDKYGEHFNRAMGDLKRAGLSDDFVYISQMNPNEDKQIIEAAFALGKVEGDIKELAKARAGTDVRDVPELVFDETQDIVDAITLENIGNLDEVNNILNKNVDLANYFMSIGKPRKEAVALATGWFNKKGQTAKINGSTLRIPTEYDVDIIEDGLEKVLDRLTVDDVTLEVSIDATIDSLRENGKFVLNSNEDGYFMLNEINQPVRDGSGLKLLNIPIADIVTFVKKGRKERARAKQEKLLQEQLQKLQSEIGG